MKRNLKPLSTRQLRKIMAQRGIKFQKDAQSDEDKIEEIGYYKLKEFAQPYLKKYAKKTKYRRLTFATLLKRYYQDKRLRIYVLTAIESIEVYLGNQFAEVIGQRYGAYGYLEFKRWCDRDLPRFKIEEQQYLFKRDLLQKIKRSTSPDVQDRQKQDADGFPTVWAMIDCLTFGDSIFLYSIMSKRNKQKIANKLNIKPRELLSALRCLNLVRNICCHNSNLIDIKIKTRLSLPKSYEQYLYRYRGNFTNHMATVLLIVKYLMAQINPKYKFDDIYYSLEQLVDNKDRNAHHLGFKNKKAILLFKS